MEFKSNKAAVLAAMKLCKKEFCASVGTLAVAEVQPLVPIDTGNLRRSIVSENMSNNEGIYIGATADAPYALAIEKGHSKKAPNGYLELGVMKAIPKITNVAESLYRSKLGGV